MENIEMKSRGYKKCEMLIEMMKNTPNKEFNRLEIIGLIAKHIGFSKLSQNRYFNALIAFKMIKKLENGNYGIA